MSRNPNRETIAQTYTRKLEEIYAQIRTLKERQIDEELGPHDSNVVQFSINACYLRIYSLKRAHHRGW